MQNKKIISNGRTNGVTWSLLELLIAAKKNLVYIFKEFFFNL